MIYDNGWGNGGKDAKLSVLMQQELGLAGVIAANIVALAVLFVVWLRASRLRPRVRLTVVAGCAHPMRCIARL